MSGFSADWLDLREDADRRARDAGLARRLADALAGRDGLAIVDLGCGLGSNLRALAPLLPGPQSWRLVDHDGALLAGARVRLAAWADAAQADGEDALRITKDGLRITVRFVRADLACDLERAIGPAADLVCAAALFDLAGSETIEAVAAATAGRRAAFHTALTYDGAEAWTPEPPWEEAAHAAFLAHQRGDKGLGPAAGPDATRLLEAAFRARGHAVSTAESPWRLDADRDGALIRALADGAAEAAAETGRLGAERIEAWRAGRRAARAVSIGHRDLLALP